MSGVTTGSPLSVTGTAEVSVGDAPPAVPSDVSPELWSLAGAAVSVAVASDVAPDAVAVSVSEPASPAP